MHHVVVDPDDGVHASTLMGLQRPGLLGRLLSEPPVGEHCLTLAVEA
jgi:hypothetical protein